MKIEFWSRINWMGTPHSVKCRHIVSLEQIGITEDQWINLTYEQKWDFAREIAIKKLDYGFKEIDE